MKDCLFCKIINGEIPSKKIFEDEKVVVIMDVNPAVDGHLLVIPKKHVTDFTELSDDLLIHINKVAKEISQDVMKKLNAKALSFCVNYGESQIIKHFHLHVLPNYHKKAKSLSIDEVYEIIKKEDFESSK